MYNVKIYDYGSEVQLRHYQKAVRKGAPEEDIELPDVEEKEDVEEEETKEVTELTKPEPDRERSLTVSMNRSVNNIYELTRANEWDYFVTLTFNDQVNRYDYDSCIGAMRMFLQRIRRSNPDMKYVMVPELHKDGAYHFHGLFSQLDNIEIVETGRYSYGKYVFKKENIPQNLIDKCRPIYALDKYRYGYSDVQNVEDTKRAASYIAKYITKELAVTTMGRKRYWHSKNCKRPIITELLMDDAELGHLIEQNMDNITYQKVVSFEAEGFSNSVHYIEFKEKKESEQDDNDSTI